MDTLMEYKCPNCAGAIAFDSEIQNMKCPYCDSEFEMDALKSYDDALKNDKELTFIKQHPIFCVNSMPTTKYFFSLKPAYLTLADPAY